jgi:hypothetical protein
MPQHLAGFFACSIELQIATELLVAALNFERCRHQLHPDDRLQSAKTALAELPHVLILADLLHSVAASKPPASLAVTNSLCSQVLDFFLSASVRILLLFLM